MESLKRFDESDFDKIKEQLTVLSKTSVYDCKSFLLMVKSFYPNSTRLMVCSCLINYKKIIEYEMAKENGDVILAANLFTKMYIFLN